MSTVFATPDPAIDWLRTQIAAGQGGDVLLVGFRGDVPQGAWAAGLRGEQDHPNYVTFARFALHKLHECQGYWLMLPAVFEGCLGYRLELRSRRAVWCGEVWMPEGGDWAARGGDNTPLLEDLLVPGAALPGIMRRDLAALADRLAVEPPAV